MTDKKIFTETFFSWAAENKLKSKDIAKELGKSQVIISNWRSKGVPKGAEYACNAYMDKMARGGVVLSIETAQETMQEKLDGMRQMFSVSDMQEDEKIKMAFVAGLDVGASLNITSATIAAQAIIGFEEGVK
tara:strand:+ start:64 stop:459 length:396 start_codon:yes stop_codon:yes gene_type:complete